MAYRILTRFDDNDIDAVQWGNYDIEKYIGPATLLTQTNFKSKINALNPDTNNFYRTVTSISRSQTPPDSSVTVQNINNPNTVDILIWINPDSSTELLYYCQQDTIYLPEDSSLMFHGFRRLSYLDITGFDTSKVTNMNSLFSYNNINFGGIIDKLSNWDVSKVTNMSNMFDSYDQTRGSGYTLDLSKWDVSNVTDMSEMFSYIDIDSINISNWNTSKVTNMSGMFSGGVKALSQSQSDNIKTNVIGIEDLDTSNVTNMNDMFRENDNQTYPFKSVDLSKWNTSKVTNMAGMFLNCKYLESLNLSNWNTSKVINMDSMFEFCNKLSTIVGTGFGLDSVDSMYNMFNNTPNLSLNQISNIIDLISGNLTIGSPDRLVTIENMLANRSTSPSKVESYNFTAFIKNSYFQGIFGNNKYSSLTLKCKIYGSYDVFENMFNGCDIDTLVFHPFPDTSMGYNNYGSELSKFCNGSYGMYRLFSNVTINKLRIYGVNSSSANDYRYNFFGDYYHVDFNNVFSDSNIDTIYCTYGDYYQIKDYVGSNTTFNYQ